MTESKGEYTVWRNRIVGHGTKPASQFQAHPLNWRKHPKRQQSAVKGSLDSLGWVSVVLENVTTGHLIDGHERVWDALQNGDAEVPFIQVELTEAEEAQALLSLDAISAMAETDAGKVGELLAQVETDNAEVMKFLAEFGAQTGATIPDFRPVGIDEQGRLDQKKPITCPECGHEFTLK